MTQTEYNMKKIKLIKKILENKKEDINSIVKPDLCSNCKGACCNDYPCPYSPNEFIDINDLDYMRSILDTGLVVIEYFDSIDRFFDDSKPNLYIRPRGIKDKKIVNEEIFYYENSCLLNDNGCYFDHVYRPIGGLLLVPEENYYGLDFCHQYYNYKLLNQEWSMYQESLNILKEEYKDKSIDIPKDIQGKVLDLKRRIIEK